MTGPYDRKAALARSRAHRLLAVAHPHEFARLLELERQRIGLGPIDATRFGRAASPPLELDVADMAARYRAGASLKTLARDLGVSTATIARRLEAAGVARRPSGRPKEARRAA